MNDCRFILDNLNDFVAVQGRIITGSDAIDVSGAEMVALADSWQVKITTVNPAPQHPRLTTTVALYLDVDGRYDNNATVGPRLGADAVYAHVSSPTGWKTMLESFVPSKNSFDARLTAAKISFENNAYIFNIPFAELPKDTKAYWRVGVAEQDGAHLTADYAPDSGLSCTVGLNLPNPAVLKVKSWLQSEWVWQGAIYAVVIMALGVIFWWKRKNKKKLS